MRTSCGLSTGLVFVSVFFSQAALAQDEASDAQVDAEPAPDGAVSADKEADPATPVKVREAALPPQSVGTFVGSIKTRTRTRDRKPCTVIEEQRVTLNVSEHGTALWHGHTYFAMRCKGDVVPAEPYSCWTRGLASVQPEKSPSSYRIVTVDVGKVAGAVGSDADVWRCGSVRVLVPKGVELSRKHCKRAGGHVDVRREWAAAAICDVGRDFPGLEDGVLQLRREALILPRESRKALKLKRVSEHPIESPPVSLTDQDGCPFPAKQKAQAIQPRWQQGVGTTMAGVEEFCEKMGANYPVKHGPYSKSYDDGSGERGYYRNDKRFGDWVHFGSGGTKRAAGAFASDQRIGLWRYWDQAGNLSGEETHSKGSLVSSTEFYAAGTRRSVRQRDGLNTRWYDNGQKAEEGEQSKGRRVGVWTTWYPTGQKRSEGVFGTGRMWKGRIGKWRFWHSNGQLAASGQFKDQTARRHAGPFPDQDVQQGAWELFDPAGQPADELELDALMSSPK